MALCGELLYCSIIFERLSTQFVELYLTNLLCKIVFNVLANLSITPNEAWSPPTGTALYIISYLLNILLDSPNKNVESESEVIK